MQGNSTDLFGDPVPEVLYRCTKCKERKPRNQFYTNRRRDARRPIRHTWCRDCSNAWHRENNKNPKRKVQLLKATLLNKFGMTLEQYEAKAAGQDDVCAICKKPEVLRKRLSVDHCHRSGKVRGLLCVSCNNLLGWVDDCPDLLRSAIDYLSRYPTD